jgi:hypothetical protein
MKMSLVVEGLRSDAVAVGELGDETVAAVAGRIADMLDRTASARILDLLSDATAELTAALPEGRIELRLVGDDVAFAYVDERPPPVEGDADLSSRITLRLSEHLKARVEDSASREGVSVNAWILRTLERGTAGSRGRDGRVGTRLQGFGTA